MFKKIAVSILIIKSKGELGDWDLNPEPPDYQSGALTSCAITQYYRRPVLAFSIYKIDA